MFDWLYINGLGFAQVCFTHEENGRHRILVCFAWALLNAVNVASTNQLNYRNTHPSPWRNCFKTFSSQTEIQNCVSAKTPR